MKRKEQEEKQKLPEPQQQVSSGDLTNSLVRRFDTASTLIKNDIYNTSIMSTRYGFFFDLASFLHRNAKYPSLLRNKVPSIVVDSIKNSKIIALKVIRFRADVGKFKNKEEEVVADIPNIRESDKDFFKAHIRSVSSMPEILLITGSDPSLFYKTRGKYKYKIYVEIKDGSIQTLQNLYQECSDLILQCERDLIDASRPIIVAKMQEDLNPHIDSVLEFSSLSINNGYYDVAEDVFDESLSNHPSFSAAEINRRLSLYENLLMLFLTANDIEEETSFSEKEAYARKIKNTIKVAISPGSGNPEGLRLFISTLRDSLETLKNLDVGFTPGVISNGGRLETPNYFNVIKEEYTFDTLIDADGQKNIGFEYFDQIEDQPGFIKISDAALDKNLLGYQKLKNLIFPVAGSIAKLNVLHNFGLSEREQITLCFNGIDVALSTAGHPEFESIVSSGEIGVNYSSISSDSQTYKNIILKILADSNVLSRRNISIDVVDTAGAGITDASTSISSVNLQIDTDAIDNFKKVISKNITVGILNTAERANNSDVSSHYYRITQYIKQKDLYPFIDLTNVGQILAESSTMKIQSETACLARAIMFKKEKDGTYNLKNPQRLSISDTDPSLEYLCILERYSNPKIGLKSSHFQLIPTLNSYFVKQAREIPEQFTKNTITNPAILSIIGVSAALNFS